MVMTRSKLAHILRAAAYHTGHSEFVLIGSASVLAHPGRIPGDMLLTHEADIYAPSAEDFDEMALSIKAGLGEGTSFHREFGYYADGVNPSTAIMPLGWRERATPYEHSECPNVIAIVPDLNDIAIAKMIAWREKDQTWLASGARSGMIDADTMHSRIDALPRGAITLPPRHEIERRLDEIERFTGRPGKVAPIHEIINNAASIGPGFEDGRVLVKWKFKSDADDDTKRAILTHYNSLARELAVRAWKLRDYDRATAWESSGRKAITAPDRRHADKANLEI